MFRLGRYVILCLVLAGCAYSKVYSFKDPEYGSFIYERPIVLAKIDGLDHRKAIEEAFVLEFMQNAVIAIEGTAVFLPTRDLDGDEIIKQVDASGGDSIVIVSLKKGTTAKQEYEIKVVGRNTGKVSWIGHSTTKLFQDGITESMELNAMFESLAKSVVARLVQENVFRRSTKMFGGAANQSARPTQ